MHVGGVRPDGRQLAQNAQAVRSSKRLQQWAFRLSHHSRAVTEFVMVVWRGCHLPGRARAAALYARFSRVGPAKIVHESMFECI